MFKSFKTFDSFKSFSVLKRGSILLLTVLSLMLCSCVGSRSKLIPASTLAPTSMPTAEAVLPTSMPTLMPTMPIIDRTVDLLGNAVTSANHFEQYIRYFDVQVYEQCSDTFVDMKIENSYLAPLKLGLKITFFDGSGAEVASAMFQSQNGQYAMILDQGTCPVYAQVNTDTAITELDFKIDFDTSFAVMPENW